MSNKAKLITLIAIVVVLVYAFFAFDIPYKKADNIVITEKVVLDVPMSGRISSPISLSGKAAGAWFFEGSFPIVLLDGSGKILAQVPAQATSDWMAPGYVPWKATISFDAGTSTSGTIRFKNDNPSGDPARDEHVDVPVTFQ